MSIIQVYRSLFLKELLLLRYDLHGLAVLFIMPMLFLLIMSLALPSDQEVSERYMQLGVVNTAQTTQESRLLLGFIQKDSFLGVTTLQEPGQIKPLIDNQQLDASLMLDSDIQQLFSNKKKGEIKVLISPGLDKFRQLQLKQYLQSVFARVKLHQFMLDLEYLSLDEPVDRRISYINSLASNDFLRFETLSRQQKTAPNAVQQSFPSWLIFGMFFIVMPLSNTLIKEKESSTLMRLKVMGISSNVIISGKFLPYFLVNAFQFLLLVLTAFYLVPLLGGQPLDLYGHWGLYALLFICISLASVGFGLLIAALAKTSEHAIVLGGGLNLIMAALGGIMIPKHVMSDSMLFFTGFSPMSWAQDAFFDLLIYQQGLGSIYLNLIILTSFGVFCFITALFIFKHKYRELSWN